MAWKMDGAVERGRIAGQRKDLAEGAGEIARLIRNGYFRCLPHLRGWPSALIFVAGCFAIIWTCTQLAQSDAFRCRSGDRVTTNGRPVCMSGSDNTLANKR